MSDIYREVFLPTGEKVVLQGDAVWFSPYRRGPDGVDHLYEQGNEFYRRNRRAMEMCR